MTETTIPDKKRKKRAHKRRPQYILQDYVRRQKKYKWLETHVWHAKRMKMIDIWNHKIVSDLLIKNNKI